MESAYGMKGVFNYYVQTERFGVRHFEVGHSHLSPRARHSICRARRCVGLPLCRGGQQNGHGRMHAVRRSARHFYGGVQ